MIQAQQKNVDGRHAYLIIAHNQFSLLKKLLVALDDPRNDIFLHIDKKAKYDKRQLVETVKKAHLYFTKSIKVTWGGVFANRSRVGFA